MLVCDRKTTRLFSDSFGMDMNGMEMNGIFIYKYIFISLYERPGTGWKTEQGSLRRKSRSCFQAFGIVRAYILVHCLRLSIGDFPAFPPADSQC